MTRKPGVGSRSLQCRVFGTAGTKAAPGGTAQGHGQVIDLSGRGHRKPLPLRTAGGRKPRPGRIYSFPLRKEPEGK